MHHIGIKLNRANALLYTIINFVNRHILRTIYFVIFDTHLNYASLIWGQNLNAVSRIFSQETLTQVHYLNLIIFLNWRQNTYREHTLSQQPSSPNFKRWFNFCSDNQNYQTFSSSSDKIFKPSFSTDLFGKYSMTIGAINSWNKTQYHLCHLSLKAYIAQEKLKFYSLKMNWKLLMKNLKGVIWI